MNITIMEIRVDGRGVVKLYPNSTRLRAMADAIRCYCAAGQIDNMDTRDAMDEIVAEIDKAAKLSDVAEREQERRTRKTGDWR